jgi:hypothetical protein
LKNEFCVSGKALTALFEVLELGFGQA